MCFTSYVNLHNNFTLTTLFSKDKQYEIAQNIQFIMAIFTHCLAQVFYTLKCALRAGNCAHSVSTCFEQGFIFNIICPL